MGTLAFSQAFAALALLLARADDPWVMSWFLALGYLTFPARLVAGALLDLWDARRLLLLGALLPAFLFLGMGLLASLPLLLLLAYLALSLSALQLSAWDTLLTRRFAERLEGEMGRLRTYRGVADLLGDLIGPSLLTLAGQKASFVLAAGL
ncbi:hypothetical protein KQ693_00340 [Thermus sp. PS18]|uniref:hypothetical protein n=1 Tax=Thermus sp. PS18 TaxID=2849039 RepID=UPI002264DFE0|nr:hypothetical protein [Thermus sp. PS18]UZX15530.1 hypothetical protein KQ693_00340 [Thermus sp. PS18]